MLKEYIQGLQDENDKKISDLQREMQELTEDLTCSEHMMEELQREKRLDTNIFSPRAQNLKLDEHIAEKKEEIRQIKQKMEYVTKMIEENLHTREEYQKLEDEIENEKSSHEEIADIKSEMIRPADAEESNEEKNKYEDEDLNHLLDDSITSESISGNSQQKMMFTEKEQTSNSNDLAVDSENFCLNKEELQNFLNTLYQKTETSLAFLNGNKNRCRGELKNCLKMIKDFSQKLQK